jgi:hypothetical protein
MDRDGQHRVLGRVRCKISGQLLMAEYHSVDQEVMDATGEANG